MDGKEKTIMTYTTVWCVTVISKSVLMHIAASVLPRLAVAIDQGSNECRRAENPKPKNSLHDADMRILFESFLGILLFDPRFSFHHIVAQVLASI